MSDGLGEYRVELESYHGPMDLLLYLIRREEIDIYDIPIARITRQYVAYIELIRQVDPEAVGEFLVMAATLMEIKSRALLPEPPAEEQDGEAEWLDPRLDLVKELLEYKAIKDAARNLDAYAREAALRHPRNPVLPIPSEDSRDLGDLQIWDLLEAFNRILEETGGVDRFHQVIVDETPIALHAEEILTQLRVVRGGRIEFKAVFAGRSRGEMIGLFLALLELIRERHVVARQESPLGGITLELLDDAPLYSRSLDFDQEFGETQRSFGAKELPTALDAPIAPSEAPFNAIEPMLEPLEGGGDGLGDDPLGEEEALEPENTAATPALRLVAESEADDEGSGMP